LDICYIGENLYKKTIKFYDDALNNNFITREIYDKINYINAVKLYKLNIHEER